MFTHIGKERGWPPTTRAQFEATRGPTGAYLIGDPEEIAEKIVREDEALGGLARITFQMTNVALPHSSMLKSIELLGTRGRAAGSKGAWLTGEVFFISRPVTNLPRPGRRVPRLLQCDQSPPVNEDR